MRYVRVPVEVVIACKVDGTEAPITLIWPDGREFEIESCAPKKKMRCEKTYGDDTFRYECVIKGKKKLLYKSDAGVFFVEAPMLENPEERNALEILWCRGPKMERI